MKKKILALSVSLLAFSISEAQADNVLDGIADAYSVLNWAGVSVTGGGAAINPPYTTFDSQSHARTADEWNINNQPTWVDNYVLNGHDTYAQSTIPVGLYDAATSMGQTSAWEVFSESTVQFMTGDYGVYSAEARARKDQSYEVTSIGTVTFSVPYSLDVTFYDLAGDNSEYGWARAWSRLRVWTWLNDDPNNSSGSWSDVITGTYTFDEIIGVGSKKDYSLTFDYYVGAINPKGTYLRLEAGADTIVYDVNPVPVPPSVLMLLTGCTSLFFMKRRRS
jgi:hypothetical protein